MSIMRIASAVALLTVLGTPARAAEPLQPTSKWNVDFGDAHCVAMRSYGSPAKPITLALKPAPIGEVMQLSVVRPKRRNEMNQYRGSLTVDQSVPVAVSVLGYPGTDGKLHVHAINLAPSAYAPVRAAKTIRLRSSGEVDSLFALSQMEAVARTLDKCVLDLRQVWHLGEHSASLKQAAISRQPLRALFSSDDYPRVALHNDGTGSVQVMMLVNEAGRIASCMVIETSGYASLDAQTCIILARRARYDPAVGLDGKPAKSGMLARIRWKT